MNSSLKLKVEFVFVEFRVLLLRIAYQPRRTAEP